MINNSISSLPVNEILIDITKNQKDGAVTGKVGETLRIGDETYYQNTFIDCSYGDEFEVTLVRSGSTTIDDGYIHFTDDKLQVIAVKIPYNSASGTVTEKIKVPKMATRMYICSYVNSVNFLAYTKSKIYKKISLSDIGRTVKNKVNMEFVSRQGQINDYPENSIHGIKCAYENGYDIIRVSVTMTADHIPVLCHDSTINRLARNIDGSIISETKYIKDLTLAQLNEYDWGRMSEKPELYGINITTLEEFIIFSKYRGIKMVLEFKYDFSDTDIAMIVSLLSKYGMLQYTTFSGGSNDLDRVFELCKYCNFAYIGHISIDLIPHALKYKNGFNEVYIDGFTDDEKAITTDTLLKIKNEGIKIKVGSAINVQEIKKWVELGIDSIEVAYVSNPVQSMYDLY